MLRPYFFCLCAMGVLFFATTLYFLMRHAAFYDTNGAFTTLDFLNFWAAPQLASEDINQLFSVHSYNAGLQRLYGAGLQFHLWSYPLHFLMLLVPLSLLPLWPAWLTWTALGLGAFGFVIWRYAAPPMRRMALLLALLAPASLVNILCGQNGFFTATLFLGALLVLQARPALSGALLALLTIKPQLGIVWPVFLLARRYWRTIIVAIALTAALLLCSLWLYGFEAWIHYVEKIFRFQISLIHSAPSERTYEPMMPTLPLALQKFGVSTSWAYGWQWGMSLAVIILLLGALRRQLSLAHTALLLSSAAMLLTPYLFNYDMTVFSGALVLYLVAQPRLSILHQLLYGAAYLLPILVYWLYFTAPIAPFIILGVFLCAALGKNEEVVSLSNT